MLSAYRSAEVRSLPDSKGCVFDFSLIDCAGKIPAPATVLRACEAAGGVEAEGELEGVMAQVAQAGGAAVAAATARPGAAGGLYTGGPGLPAGMHSMASAGGSSILAGGPMGGRIPGMSMQSASAVPPSVPPTQSIPSGRFAFVFAGSADKRKTLGSAASASATHASLGIL